MKKVFAILCAVAMMALMAVPAFAAEVTPVTADDFNEVLTTIGSQFSVTTIVQLLAALVGAVIGIVFMWWGVRKVSAAIMKAVKTGRFGL